MTMPNSSSEDEVTMAAPTAVALKATRLCRQMLSSCSVPRNDFCAPNIVAISVLASQNGRGCAIGLRGFFTSQRAHVTKTSVGRTETTTFRGVRSWTTHAGNQTTNGRVMRVPSGIRQNVSTPKKASTLTSRASAVHLWSWRRGRNSTISGS